MRGASAWVPPCLRYPGVRGYPSAADPVEEVAAVGVGDRRSLYLEVSVSLRAYHWFHL